MGAGRVGNAAREENALREGRGCQGPRLLSEVMGAKMAAVITAAIIQLSQDRDMMDYSCGTTSSRFIESCQTK